MEAVERTMERGDCDVTRLYHNVYWRLLDFICGLSRYNPCGHIKIMSVDWFLQVIAGNLVRSFSRQLSRKS